VTLAVLRLLHRWIGLALALPLIQQALTGRVMTTEPFVARAAHAGCRTKLNHQLNKMPLGDDTPATGYRVRKSIFWTKSLAGGTEGYLSVRV